jgi:DNA segregation ATPase FtsK/SpoIIIE, S-DNA-T family
VAPVGIMAALTSVSVLAMQSIESSVAAHDRAPRPQTRVRVATAPLVTNGRAPETIGQLLRRTIMRRLGQVIGGVLLVALVLLAVALASWSVKDPSINNAVDGPVRNWLKWPGAYASDIVIQLFGLSVLALMLPLFRWSAMLLRRQTLDRMALRLGALVAGVAASAAFASLLPRADSWPLPTGLGGAIGDALERLPLALLGTSGIAKAVAALACLGVAIILIHFAQSPAQNTTENDEQDAAVDRALDADEDEPRADEPGTALVVLGAIAYSAVLMKRRIAARITNFRANTGRKMGDSARRLVENATREEPVFADTAPQHAPSRVVMREAAPSPTYRREPVMQAQPAPVATPAAEPHAGYGVAVAALQAAARRRLGLAVEEPKAAPTPVEPGRAGERAAIEALQSAARRRLAERGGEPEPVEAYQDEAEDFDVEPAAPIVRPAPQPIQPRPVARVGAAPQPLKPSRREVREAQPDLLGRNAYELPPISLLNEPKRTNVVTISEDALEQNARLLEGVLEDFGVKGEILQVRPGPVVTLYELEPAPGTKSSRVIGLADDIARSMSAISARVAVVSGRNAIGIELPNQRRETVYFREMIASQDFERSPSKLAVALGKTIGGEPVIAELAKMPHLLVAGTTGSGKSVAINTMILSLLYRLTPEQCRLIMIDPKMLELSVYDGIPHLLTPVVTDPKKAVVALKWAVREMEDRYKKMSKVGVRNIDGFNARVAEAQANGEIITRTVQTGFDKETGEAIFQEEEMPLERLPYIVVLIDEMADLMMVAGKDIEGAVQRLAQMARAAGIHVIMATQRPSVDVITGTIKANFPTRISFQVTSKIDSRTILGEMGAEQLLGQGDMLYMAGGGRINRVHGPFVSDEEVERVVNHLKRQGRPQYLDAITRDEDEGGEDEGDSAVFDKGEFGEEGGDLYDQAVRIVLRDKKASTSYIQRRLQIGYNRAASLMERMETEGVVGAANHAGKREILMEGEE